MHRYNETSYFKININRYIKTYSYINDLYHAEFTYKNVKLNCRILTGTYCGLTEIACDNYAKINYPIGSNITLYYDMITGYCRPESFVNNLFIVGIVFLSLSFISLCRSNFLFHKYNLRLEDFEDIITFIVSLPIWLIILFVLLIIVDIIIICVILFNQKILQLFISAFG